MIRLLVQVGIPVILIKASLASTAWTARGALRAGRGDHWGLSVRVSGEGFSRLVKDGHLSCMSLRKWDQPLLSLGVQ